MKKLIKKLIENSENILLVIFGIILIALLIALIYGISWILTCGVIKLVCLCFGLNFSWAVATGIWLVMILLRSIFGKSGGKD